MMTDRTGRWVGRSKTECELHTDLFKHKELTEVKDQFVLNLRNKMRSPKQEEWVSTHTIQPEWMGLARQAIGEIRNGRAVMDALRHYPLKGGGYLGKYVLVAAYHEMVRNNEMNPDARLLESLRMKPMRTLSGVTTVTVLTKPYPCPGKCIFCPTDVRMPKSYLADEPGAMRGTRA